jgi:hypothetical protein
LKRNEEMSSFLEQFELHCANLQLPDRQRRSAADEFLTALRTSAKPYELCFSVLSHKSASAVAQAQASMTIRGALLREWSSMTRDELVSLRVALLESAVGHEASTAGFVQRQLLETVALLAKCMWLDHPELQDDVFGIISQLLQDGTTLEQQHRAIDLASSLVNQFASAGQMNLTFEFHDACKTNFQTRFVDFIIL